MKRIKSIDNLRGLIIILMIYLHLFDWWLIEEDQWFFFVNYIFLDRILGGGGFLFIAGISAALFVRIRLIEAKNIKNNVTKKVKIEYYLRALFILIIALIFNFFVAVGVNNPLDIWKWFLLLTMAISLIMSFPFLKTSKSFRISVAVIIWMVNHYVLSFLLLHQGQPNLYGMIFHILYNSLDLEPILSYFSFLLIGTVMGDVIFNIYQIDNQNERRIAIKNKILFPSLIMGMILIILALFFPFSLYYSSFSWKALSMGTILVILSVFIVFEEFKIFNTKKSYSF